MGGPEGLRRDGNLSLFLERLGKVQIPDLAADPTGKDPSASLVDFHTTL